jgi:hypothetical protein
MGGLSHDSDPRLGGRVGMRGRERTVLGPIAACVANIVERTLSRARSGSAQAEACALRSPCAITRMSVWQCNRPGATACIAIRSPLPFVSDFPRNDTRASCHDAFAGE